MTDTRDEALTEDEHKALALTGQLAELLARITGHHVTREPDLAETLHHLHIIQNAVLAQAAARAYPTRYRLLGGTLTAARTETP